MVVSVSCEFGDAVSRPLRSQSGDTDLSSSFTRHRRHQHHELKPWYMAFRKDDFKRISQTMNLPADYLFLRRGAGGCGAFMKHTTFSENGSVSHLGELLLTHI